MDFQLVLSFLLLAVPAYFTPGPNNLLLLASSLKFGWRRTLPHAGGIAIGFPFMVFLVGLGLGEIFTQMPMLKTVLKFVASAYFLFMAWQLLGFSLRDVRGNAKPMSFLQAALFQWVNPKAWTMAVSLASLFVMPGAQRYGSLFWLTFGCLALSPPTSALWMLFGQNLHAFLVKTGTEKHVGILLAGLMVLAVALFLL